MVLAFVDIMESVRLKMSPRLMLIPDTMVDTEAMVLVWDTGPMAMVDMVLVDTMASVRLKLSPRLMLILTTMVDMDLDMDWEDTMVDTEVMVLVWDQVLWSW